MEQVDTKQIFLIEIVAITSPSLEGLSLEGVILHD